VTGWLGTCASLNTRRANETGLESPRDGKVHERRHGYLVRWCACIADRQHLPLMPFGFVPIDHAAAVFGVDLHVHRPAYAAAICDPCDLDSGKDRIEFFLRHAKAEMIDRKILVRVDEVERQSVIDEDGGKRPDSGCCPRDPKQVGEKLRRGDFVARRHDGVIEMNGYRWSPARTWKPKQP